MSVLGIIGDILSIFGLGSSRSDRQKSNGSSSTDVRIERVAERSEASGGASGEAATESEAAVKSTEESPEHDEREADDEEPAATETDAAASTASMADESGESEVAEEAEAADVTEHAGTEESAAEPAEAAGPVPTEPEAGEEPVDSISGIGQAYAKRLNEAGIESVADLVAADAAEVADETGLSEKRIRGWQDAAE
jgi:predicted flap endonuclease-1-like 5' DNA nuclease